MNAKRSRQLNSLERLFTFPFSSIEIASNKRLFKLCASNNVSLVVARSVFDGGLTDA